ncbi:MAG: 30S ribosomal protein S2 [Candidatus Micrarchaeota archaeon]|nr:MAG: 30S ribosomal protein S2 [Candidatus Micrarchaeota archaeon]
MEEKKKKEVVETDNERADTDKNMLVSQNEYIESGIYIGSRVKASRMKRFIYRVRDDGIYLLNIEEIDKRIKAAANMISRYNGSDIVITASRLYAISAAEKFAEIIGAKIVKDRVNPGIFTNPNNNILYLEPKLVIINDTRNERQAVREASKINVPIIALCDTDNSISYVDLVIPANNRGKRSLTLIYYLLAREVLKNKGLIKSNSEFKYTISDFEGKITATQNQTDQQ